MNHTTQRPSGADREHIDEGPNPLGLEGIEFIEYATSKPQALGQVLEAMGFRPIARHRSREVLLYRQGDINIIVNAHGRGAALTEKPVIAAIALKLIGLGVPQRLAAALSWFITALVAIALLWGAKAMYDRSVVREHDAKVTAKTIATDAAAKIEAAEQRATDTAAIAQSEKERSDAINQAEDGKPSDASVRLNCERLRKSGKDTSRIAACAGLGR